MRAREFVSEGKQVRARSEPAHEFEQAHPGLVLPGGKGDVYWGRYYDHYRVSSLAGMDPDDIAKIDEISFWGNLPVFSAYTEYDRRKLKAIMKKLKMNPTDAVGDGSYETNGTNKISPLKAFPGYKR